MKLISLRILLAIAATVLFSGVITVGVIWKENFYYIKNLQLKPQKRGFWCWAASIQMLHDYKKNYVPADTISQCAIVRERDKFEKLNLCYGYNPFGDRDTCGCDNDFGRDRGLSNVLTYGKVFNKFNIKVDSVKGMFSWEKVKTELNEDKPFMLHNTQFATRIDPLPGGGHVVVVGGFVETSSFRLLLLNDPWNKCSGCTYLLNYDIVPNNEMNLDSVRTIFLSEPIKTERTIAASVRESVYNLESKVNRFFSKDKSSDNQISDEGVFISKVIEEISSTSPEVLKSLGFSSAHRIKERKPGQGTILKILDEEKILDSNSLNIEDYVKKTDLYKAYPIQNEERGMTTITIRKVVNGGSNFWIIDNITKCNGLIGIENKREVYQLNTPDQNYLFEVTSENNKELLNQIDTYTDALNESQRSSYKTLNTNQKYSCSEVINFLKPILITYKNGK